MISVKLNLFDYIPDLNKNINNTECVVCLDDLNHKTTFYTCSQCNNGVHVKCWNMYLVSSFDTFNNLNSLKCGVCRTTYLQCLLK